MAKTLVIGGNGFLGSHLVDSLADLGHDTYAFDRFTDRTIYRANDVQKLAGDFLDATTLASITQDKDVVFHFLSTTTPATADADPSFDVRSNVMGTLALLDACVTNGVKKVVFASTGGAIYGVQGNDLYSENDPALPISPYGIGKLTIERYFDYYQRRHGLEYVIFRISNPFGPRQHPEKPQGLIPIAMRLIARGEPVVKLGDGSMVRDYAYVTDVAAAVTRVTDLTTQYRLYNIGSGHGQSVNEVFSSLRKVTGHNFDILERPQPASFVDSVTLDVSRYEQEFGSIAQTPFEDGLRKTWQSVVEGSA